MALHEDNGGQVRQIQTHQQNPVDVDPRLLDVLVCPLTRSALHYDRARQELISQQARESLSGTCWCAIMLVEKPAILLMMNRAMGGMKGSLKQRKNGRNHDSRTNHV